MHEIAVIFLSSKLLPVAEYLVSKFSCTFLAKHFDVLDHLAFVVPGLLSLLVKLYLDVSIVFLLVLQIVIVTYEEVLIVEVSFADVIYEFIKVGISDVILFFLGR